MTPAQIAATVTGSTDDTSQYRAALEAAAMAQSAEIYIVQNDLGDVVDVFWTKDNAKAAAHEGAYSVIEETVWA